MSTATSLRIPGIEYRSIVAACFVSERASEPTLAGAGFAGDQEVLSPPDPVAGCELGKQRLVETARRLGIEVLDGRVLPEVGKLEPRDEPFAFALDGLAIDEEAEALLERGRSHSGLLSLLLERFGHAGEAEGDEPVVCGSTLIRTESDRSTRLLHRHAVDCSTYPRGPRSGPGCSVPVRHHLIGPIRPARGHIAISPHGGLYAMPSLCGSA
jgi:hypothetical protein